MLNKFRVPEIVLGMLFASGFWAGILGWQASDAPTERQKQECYDAAKKSATKAEECKTFWEKTTSDPVSLFTFILALTTGGLWIATIGLYLAGEKQIAVANKTADAAKEAAVAAEKSANALPIIEGAYLFPDIIIDHVADSLSAFEQSQVKTNRLIIEFQVKNFGRTPALIQSVHANLIHPDSINGRAFDNDHRKTVRKTILGSGEPTERLQTEIADFSREEAAHIKSGQSQLYFTGKIFYFDIWGQRWALFFDWEFSPSQGKFIPNHRPRDKAD